MDIQIKYSKCDKAINDNDVKRFIDFIENNQTEAVKLMLEQGMSANATDRAGNTALLYAIVIKNPDIVELLINYGANIEGKIKEGFTLLILSSVNDCLEIVELFLKNGASTEETDDNNVTALMHAAESGHTKMVQLLIRYGAKVQTIGLDGKTALVFAASRGHLEVVKWLIFSGASVHELSKVRNKSVIMYAARDGKTAVVDLLIQAGANIKLKDSDDLTALDHAANNKHTFTAYRLLAEYSLEERDEFATDSPENLNIADGFDKELYTNQEKIYLILRTPYKLHADSEKECYFSLLPVEMINIIKFFEAKLQNFPDWYQHRVECDVHLGFNLMTLAYDAQKKKSSDNLKESNQSVSKADIDLNDLNNSISALKLN